MEVSWSVLFDVISFVFQFYVYKGSAKTVLFVSEDQNTLLRLAK